MPLLSNQEIDEAIKKLAEGLHTKNPSKTADATGAGLALLGNFLKNVNDITEYLRSIDMNTGPR